MNNKGNALLEFLMGTGLWMLGLTGILYVSGLVLAKWTALDMAQLGTDLQASTNLSADDIRLLLLEKIEIKNFPHSIQWEIDLHPPDFYSVRFYNLVQTRVTAQVPGPFLIEEVVVSQKEPYE